MKKKSVFILLIIFSFIIGQEGWNSQNSIINNNLNDVFICDSNIVYISGENGIILKTINGGNNWVLQKSNVNTSLSSIYFTCSNNGWIVGQGGVILHTIDGGNTWIYQGSSDTTNFRSIQMFDSLTGWVLGDSSVFKTTDGGNNWKCLYSVNYGFGGISFTDTLVGWAVYWSCIGRTSDGGFNWVWYYPNIYQIHLSSIFFVNPKFGWASGSKYHWMGSLGSLLSTTDGGSTWRESTFSAPLGKIFFCDSLNGWMLGALAIWQTSDGGRYWRNRKYGTFSKIDINSIKFLNKNIGWLVGNRGVIVHTNDGGESWIFQTNNVTSVTEFNEKIIGYMLLQNYPNPFNSVTNLQYHIPYKTPVHLKIIDIHGKQILTLVDQTNGPGDYKISWDASSLPSGVYFYILQTKEFQDVKKCLIIK